MLTSPHTQCCGFSSSHVMMWKLDHKEDWAPKNWCFQIVVLEKTLESPLDCKEIKPVNLKENQTWLSIGRTDAEAGTPILCPPHTKSQLTRKDPDAERDWVQEEKGWQKVRWLDSIINSTDMNLSKLWETVKDRGAWCATVHEDSESQTRPRDWKTTK